MNLPITLSYLQSPIFLSVQNAKQKRPRMSEPNLIIEHFDFPSEKIKETAHKFDNNKIRKPRLTEAFIPSPSTSNLLSSEHHEPLTKLMRENCLKGEKSMIKSAYEMFIKSEVDETKRNGKKMEVFVEEKIKKRQIEEYKETLNVIEKMLNKHKINGNCEEKSAVGKSFKKTNKSPRYSENLLIETEYKLTENRKENESYGNKTKHNQEPKFSHKELKETSTTHSSFKKIVKLKIEDFVVIKEIGRGKFGIVKLAKHIKTGMILCLKMIKKSEIEKQEIIEQLIKEIKIQSFLNQPNIIKLYGIFDDFENVYLLLEFCNDGNLYQHMLKRQALSENESKTILRAICEAISEMQSHHIIHRDLKPENIVLSHGMAKICDFGWSTEIKDEMRETFCGTPLYVSPELLGGRSYDEKIDLWSLGILSFEMMTGQIPFSIKSEGDLSQIIKAEIIYPKDLSQSAISFLRCLLNRDPSKRKNIREMLGHPFLEKEGKK